MVSVKKSVSDGKTKVAAAITARGQATANDATYDVMAGKTFYSTNPKSKATGTMVNRGAVTQTLNAGEVWRSTENHSG